MEIYFTQTSQTFTDNVVHSHAKSQSFAKFLRRLRRLRESFSHRRHGRHRILAARFCLTQTPQTFTDDVVDSHAKAQSIAKFSAHVCVVCVRQKYVLMSKKFCVIPCVPCANKSPRLSAPVCVRQNMSLCSSVYREQIYVASRANLLTLNTRIRKPRGESHSGNHVQCHPLPRRHPPHLESASASYSFRPPQMYTYRP